MSAGGGLRRSRFRRRVVVPGLALAGGESVLDASEVEADGEPAVAAATTAALVLVRDGAEVWRRAWHELDRGVWDADTRVLALTAVDGWACDLHLPDDGRLGLAVAVRDRVQASVVVTRHVPAGRDRSVRLVVRRVFAGPDAGSLVVQELPPPGVRVTGDLAAAVRRHRTALEESLGLPVTER